MSDRIQQLLKICILGLGFTLFALPAHATFIGTDVTFSLIEPSYSDLVQTVEASDALEVSGGDGSAIGNIMMSGGTTAPSEYIDIGSDYIEFQIFGGAEPFTNGFGLTGFGSGTKYQLDFTARVLALFETPTATDLSLADITGVTFDTELMLAGNSLMLFVDTLGVDLTDNFGTLRLDFQLKDISAIPVPAALPLMLSGLAMIGFLARRRKN